MKKALVLVTLASLAAASFGCVATDYPQMPTQNKSHGLIGCQTNDRIANSQQTIEAQTRDLLYSSCVNAGDLPSVSLDYVSSADARDWNRFNANHAFLFEIDNGPTPPFNGVWIQAGVKDLADGSVRINTMHAPSSGAFSCVGSSVDGRYGGPEGVLYGEQFDRLPGLHIDTLAIDRTAAPAYEFCPNIVAVDPHIGVDGVKTYVAYGPGRGGEGSLAATPITRREGNLGNLLAGGTESVTVKGVTITGRGHLNANGTIKLELLGLSNGVASYQAESPLSFTVNPANNFRTIKIENQTEAELARLAAFGLDSGIAGVPQSLAGEQIREFGFTFPAVELLISPAALQHYIENPGDWR